MNLNNAYTRTACRTNSLRFITGCVFIFIMLLVMLPAISFGKDTGSAGIHVNFSPSSIPPGGISLVRITVPPDVTVTRIHFLKQDFPVFRDERHGWFALVGAGLKVHPGRHSLVVQYQSQHDREIFAANLHVIEKKYPEEHLKVAKKMVNFSPEILKRVLADQKAVRRACSHITHERYWTGPFIWPVNSKILSPFGLRRFFNNQPRSPHSGVDLRAREGTPIVAPANGRVILARDCYLSGRTLVIDHGGGLYTLYAHFSKFVTQKGKMVKKGQVIGLAGSSGRATGSHLHWGVSLAGTRVDPQQFMEIAQKL